MGYTHYWYKIAKLDKEDFKCFIQDFEKLRSTLDADLDQNGDQKLESTSEILYFNGIGENAHETFYFDRVNENITRAMYHDTEKDHIFSFCKTARKPYDLAVCSALIIAKKYFGDDIIVSSDGEDEDGWKEAKSLCQVVLNYGLEFDINSGGFNLVTQS